MRKILLLPIMFYRYFISPFFPKMCRFEPTCSEYSIDAIKKHGGYGLYLTLKRILRCNPFCEAGFDPVPENNKKETDK